MITLTEAAHWTKRLVWFVGPGFFLFFLVITIIIGRDATIHIPEYNTPEPYCTQDMQEFLGYQLEISSVQQHNPEQESFQIETDTGRYEEFPEIINVYEYDNLGQTFTSRRDAQRIAEQLGFDPEEIQTVDTATYGWSDEYGRELEVKASNLPFEYEVDLSQDDALPPEEGNLPSDNQAISEARSFLRSANLDIGEYSDYEPSTMYIEITRDGSFREARARVDADLVRVDFQRQKSMITIEEHKEGAEATKDSLERRIGEGIYSLSTDTTVTDRGREVETYTFDIGVTTEDPYESNISIYIGAENENWDIDEGANIYAAKYSNWIIEDNHCGTYELISPGLAIDNITQGDGSLVYLRERDADRVIEHQEKNVEKFEIRNITLRYYDDPKEQRFLKPVYEISGNVSFSGGNRGEFLFYYSAIDYEAIHVENQEDDENETT